MGSVFLAVTGAETLYADTGHFGRKRQGALVLETRAAVETLS